MNCKCGHSRAEHTVESVLTSCYVVDCDCDKYCPILDEIIDVVLTYHPKIKTKAAKRRARRNKRTAKVKDKPKSRE